MQVEIKVKAAGLEARASLIPFQGNLKTLSKENYQKFKHELIELGFSEPISIWQHDNKNYILNGHQRLRTLNQMATEGVTIPDQLPVSYVEADTYKQAKKKVLALTAQFGEITSDGLYEFLNESDLEFAEIKDDMRFPEIDLDKFEAEFYKDETEGLTDEDAVPDTVPTRVKPGEVWQLGEHKVMCGDATKDIDKLMAGDKADMVFTDPPYGMNLDTDFSSMKTKLKMLETTGAPKSGGNYKKVIGDDSEFNATHILKVFKDVAEVFLWGADYYKDTIPNGASWLVWDKRIDESMDKVFGSSFELCWSKSKHKRDIIRIRWAGIFGTEKEHDRKRVHPTQKPTALAEWFINKYGKTNIVDLYGGSGSTLIACEKTNRKCYMMEIDPHYCDVILKRWEEYTGKKAELLTV